MQYLDILDNTISQPRVKDLLSCMTNLGEFGMQWFMVGDEEVALTSFLIKFRGYLTSKRCSHERESSQFLGKLTTISQRARLVRI